MAKLRIIVNCTCGLFLIALLLILLLHEGSFNSIRAVFNANAAVKQKYGNSDSKLTCRLIAISIDKATETTFYTVEYFYVGHHGTVEENYDGHTFRLLQIREN